MKSNFKHHKLNDEKCLQCLNWVKYSKRDLKILSLELFRSRLCNNVYAFVIVHVHSYKDTFRTLWIWDILFWKEKAKLVVLFKKQAIKDEK